MASIKQDWIVKLILKGGEKLEVLKNRVTSTLKATEVQAAKTSTGFRGVTNAASNYFSKSKGVAGATNNQTKAFSKMERGMEGLVPAYATVAANIFALTAAFGALSRAADFQVMVAGAESLATQTGRSLIGLAQEMKKVTDGAITMKEALTSASIAASAGFDNKTIVELTEVARNASIALGRDMTDAMNRVFKGAVKAEPELLDELGIILRLDPATRKYAASIGKAASELTTFQKQQAIANEVIKQGQEKFSKLGEVDVNSLNQLSAGFLEIAQSVLSFINSGIGPFINLLTDNVYLLGGAMAVFGASIAKTAIPALQKMSDEVAIGLTTALSTAANSIATTDLSAAMFEGFQDDLTTVEGAFAQTFKEINNSFGEFGDSLPDGIKDGVLTTMADGALLDAESVRDSLALVNNALDKTDKAIASGETGLESQKTALLNTKAALGTYELGLMHVNEEHAKLEAKLKQSSTAWSRFVGGIKLQKLATVQGFLAGTSGGFTRLIPQVIEFSKRLDKTNREGLLFGVVLKKIAVGTFFLSGALGSLIKAIPFFGQIAFIFGILKTSAEKLFSIFRKNNDEIVAQNEAFDDLEESLNSILKTAKNYEASMKNLPNSIDNVTKKLTAQANVLNTLAESIESIIDKQELLGGFDNWDKFFDYLGFGKLDTLKDDIIPDTLTAIKNLDLTEATAEMNSIVEAYGGFAKISGLGGAAALLLGKELGLVIERFSGLKNVALDANKALIDNIEALGKAMDSLKLGKLTDVEKIYTNLNATLREIEGKDVEYISSAITSLPTSSVFAFNIEDQVAQLTKYNNKVEESRDKLELVEGQLARNNKLLEESKMLAIADDAASVEAQTAAQAVLFNVIQKNKEEQARYKEEIKAATDAMQEFTDTAIEALKEQLVYYSRLSKAQEHYNATITSISAQKGIPLQDTRDKIDLLQKEAAAQLALNNLERTASTNELAKINKSLKNVDPNNIAQEKSLLETQYRLRAKLRDTEEKNAQIYLKQRATLVKILDNVIKIEAIGLFTDISSAEVMQGITEATINLGRELKQNDATIQSNIAKFEGYSKIKTIVEQFNEEVGKTPEKILGSIRSIINVGKAYDNQTNLLREYNGLVDERIDKELLYAEAVVQSNIISTLKTISELSKLAIRDLTEERKLADLLGLSMKFLEESARTRDKQIENSFRKEIEAGNLKIRNAQAELNAGINLTILGKQRLALVLATNKAYSAGYVSSHVKVLIKNMKELNEIKFEKEFLDTFQNALPEAIVDLNKLFQELNETVNEFSLSTNKWDAAFAGGIETSRQFGDDTGEAFGQAAILVKKFGEDLNTYISGGWANVLESGTDALMGIGAAIQQAAGDNIEAARAGAVIEGLGAMVKAWNSVPFPYNIPVIAATAAGVSNILSQMGESIDTGNASGGGFSSPDQVKESFGTNGIQGVDMQSNALIDSLDDLMNVDKDLFGATAELQNAVMALKRSFDSVGAILINTFSSSGLKTSFGFTGLATSSTSESSLYNAFTGIATGGLSLNSIPKGLRELDIVGKFFSTTTKVEEELVSAGLSMGASIHFVGGELVGSLNEASQFIIKEVTKTKSKFFGLSKSTSSKLKTVFSGLDENLLSTLELNLSGTLNVLTKLFTSFGVNMKETFEAYNLIIPDTKLDLVDKTAQEQAEIVAGFFSHLGNQIVSDAIPWIENFQIAGEELTDTLIRLTKQTISVNNTLSQTGNSTDSLSSLGTAEANRAYQPIKDKYTTDRGNINLQIGEASRSLTYINSINKRIAAMDFARVIANIDSRFTTAIQAYNFFDKLDSGDLGGGLSTKERAKFAKYYKSRINGLTTSLNDVSLESWSAFLLRTKIEWEQALLAAFDGNEGYFDEVYTKFANALFSPEELSDQAIANAKGQIDLGLGELIPKLSGTGLQPFGKTIESSLDSLEDFRLLYDKLEEQGAFAGKAGAELYAVMIKTGAGFGYLKDEIETVDDTINTFLRDITRQIELFGLAGKEADLLQLSFERTDDLERAETLAEINAVETLYGLKRLEIIQNYNDEIVDQLTGAYTSVADAMLQVIKTSSAYTELAYQSLKIENILRKLLVTSGGKFKDVIQPILDSLTNTGRGELEDVLGQWIIFSEEVPGNIAEEIALTMQLKDAIIDRYTSELSMVESLEQASKDIKDYLQNLIVGDKSPATNKQKLDELLARYSTDLTNINSADKEVAAKAASSLLKNADAILDVGKNLYGIGPDYDALFAYITQTLSETGTSLDDLILEETVILTELQVSTLAQLESVNSILGILKEEQQQEYWADLTLAINDLETPLNEIVTLLSNKDTELTNSILGGLSSIPRAPALNPPRSVAIGTDEVKFDQLANIHKGEMIVPAEAANSIRSGEATLGTEKSINTENIVNAIGILTQVLAEGQDDLLDQGEQQLATSRELASSQVLKQVASTRGIL